MLCGAFAELLRETETNRAMVAIGNDDADGPTRITGKSMFGPQVLSQRHTAAAHGFGSSTRAHASKLFIGGEHAKLSSAQNSDTPGPHYATLGSVGTQAEGGKPSPPTWKLGKADRFVHDRYAARFQGASPGPGTYNHGSSVGRQPFSTNTTFPKYGFGTSNREQCSKLFVSSQHSVGGSQSPGPASVGQMSELSGSKYGFGTERRLGTSREDAASAAIPGPGAYRTTSSVGFQHSSSHQTQPAFGFGSSNREHAAKLYVSNAMSRGSGYSPGPCYSLTSSVGAQPSTRGRTAPGWGFGKSNRFAVARDTGTPGPGAYAI